MDDPKFCVNCAHFNSADRDCEHPANKQIDIVRGRLITRHDPAYLRDLDNLCGPAANWFVEKEEAWP